jgi:hypothetical protein
VKSVHHVVVVVAAVAVTVVVAAVTAVAAAVTTIVVIGLHATKPNSPSFRKWKSNPPALQEGFLLLYSMAIFPASISPIGATHLSNRCHPPFQSVPPTDWKVWNWGGTASNCQTAGFCETGSRT